MALLLLLLLFPAVLHERPTSRSLRENGMAHNKKAETAFGVARRAADTERSPPGM
jgi:hypothetical protein